MSLTPPSVDAVKGMLPLQSISSDGSDFVSSPDFSLTEMDLSKVSIADDLEKTLDISSATQGNRMVTAVEVGRDNGGNFDWNLLYISLTQQHFSNPLISSLSDSFKILLRTRSLSLTHQDFLHNRHI